MAVLALPFMPPPLSAAPRARPTRRRDAIRDGRENSSRGERHAKVYWPSVRARDDTRPAWVSRSGGMAGGIWVEVVQSTSAVQAACPICATAFELKLPAVVLHLDQR